MSLKNDLLVVEKLPLSHMRWLHTRDEEWTLLIPTGAVRCVGVHCCCVSRRNCNVADLCGREELCNVAVLWCQHFCHVAVLWCQQCVLCRDKRHRATMYSADVILQVGRCCAGHGTLCKWEPIVFVYFDRLQKAMIWLEVMLVPVCGMSCAKRTKLVFVEIWKLTRVVSWVGTCSRIELSPK